jgi:tetratricopeptide (TPR) repeat protein
MTREPADSQDSADRLGAVLATGIEAVDHGGVDPEMLIARHPELAAELRAFFADQDRLDRLAAPLRNAAHGGATLSAVKDTTVVLVPGSAPVVASDLFPDYELLEECGRGGMGLVYKARQKSLGRLVALKVLRTDPLAPADERRRFHNEAELMALLDHPGIVPVHEVGECPGGLYLAMKLLEGGTLSQKPGRYREDPKAAARLLAEIAHAVHHAHQRGVLHRDLKPSNVLLDGDGRPHVADFGLARRIGGDSALTQSGSIIGTPSYMAPEQATGRRGTVTTATDVHGLGGLLYFVLAGKPPFEGPTVLDTLEQVRTQAPKPPSARNPRVSRDLETICLKCLEKQPERRYGSAEAVALDLERWLRGEPILARPVSRPVRLWHWCRRNPVVSSLLALVVLGSAGSSAWITWQMAQTKAEYQRAQQNLDMAYQVLDELYLDQVGKRLEGQQELSPDDRKFMERILGFYQQFAEGNSREPATRVKMARAYRRVSDIQFALGDYPSAVLANERSIGILGTLVEDFPSVQDYWKELASGRINWGHALLLSGRLHEAEQAYGQAAVFSQERLQSSPADRVYKAGVAAGNLNRFNPLFMLGRDMEAEQAGRTAIRLYQQLTADFPDVEGFVIGLLTTHDNLGELLLDSYRLDEAEETYKEMERITERRKQDFPKLQQDELKHGRIHAGYGFVLRVRGRLAEAKAHYDKALAHMIPYEARCPSSPDAAPVMAEIHCQLALILQAEGKLTGAEASLRRAQESAALIVQRCPGVPCYPSQLAQIQLDQGNLFQVREQCEEAEKSYALARQLLEKLAVDYPARATDRSNLAAVLDRQAELLLERGQRGEAKQLLDRAHVHHEAALKANPKHAFYQQHRDHHQHVFAAAGQQAPADSGAPDRKK